MKNMEWSIQIGKARRDVKVKSKMQYATACVRRKYVTKYKFIKPIHKKKCEKMKETT